MTTQTMRKAVRHRLAHRYRTPAVPESGFTLAEIIVVTSLTLIVSAAILSVTLGAIGLVGRTQVSAATDIQVSETARIITDQLKNSVMVVPENQDGTNPRYASDHIAYIYPRNTTTCEYHQYWISAGTLKHGVYAIDGLAFGDTCMANYTRLYDNRTSLENATTELTGLQDGSKFTYLNVRGMPAPPLESDPTLVSFTAGETCSLDPHVLASNPRWVAPDIDFRGVAITLATDGVNGVKTVTSVASPRFVTMGSAKC